MQPAKKILHLIDIPWWSGLASYAVDSMQAQQMLGYEVSVIAPKQALIHTYLKKCKVKIFIGGSRKFLGNIFNFFLIGAQLFLESPDLICAHTGSTHSIAIFWGIFFQIPIIRTRATAQKLKSGFWGKLPYQLSHKIVFASHHLLEEFHRCYPQFNQKKLVVIVPYVNSKESSDCKENYPLRIGVLARLDPVKGHKVILKAAEKVCQKIAAVEFRFAGSEENLSWGELKHNLFESARQHIFYDGFLSADKIETWMRSIDIAVLASVGSEEVSRALLEWMALGKPVIATKVGSIPEFLQDDSVLVAANNAEALAAALIKMLESSALRKNYGQRNWQHSRNYFSQEKFNSAWKMVLLR